MQKAAEFDVFLSHSSHDKPVVRELAKRLKKAGLQVWFDEWEIPIGAMIAVKIEEGLAKSNFVILCMSKHAVGSDWATLESRSVLFSDPLNLKLRLIPLLLDDTPIPELLKGFKYLDWRKPNDAAYQSLLAACRKAPLTPAAKIVSPEQTPPVIAPKVPEPPRQASSATVALCAAALAKLEKTITIALNDTAASEFKNTLCDELALPQNKNPAQIMAALDALPELPSQMYTLQRAILNWPIPLGAADEPHPIERAAEALYMRAGIRAVNLAAAEAMCGAATAATRVPEKSEVLIAVLMAALKGEVRSLRLCDEPFKDGQVLRQAKGDALIDLDELPFYPFMTNVAITNEVGARVHKGFSGLDAQGKEMSRPAIESHIKSRVRQSRAVLFKDFRFIVSDAKTEFAYDEAMCEKLYASLGIPTTKIVADTPGEVDAVLGISVQDFHDLFVQFLELIISAKQPAKPPAAE